MRYSALFFLSFLILISFSFSGELDTEQELNELFKEQYVDTVSELPIYVPNHVVPSEKWTPTMNWWIAHCEGDSIVDCIRGYIYIVGFKNTARQNGIYYINGSIRDNIVLDYQTYIRVNTRHLFLKWNYLFDVYRDGDYVVAHLTATAILFGIDISGFKFFNNVTADFIDLKQMPITYTYDNNPIIYGETFTGKYNSTVLHIENVSEMVTSYTVTTGNGSYIKHLKLGTVRYTDTNIPYMDLSDFNQFEVTGAGIYKALDGIALTDNVTSIVFQTPFSNHSYPIENITYTHNLESSIDLGVFTFIIPMMFFLGGIYVFLKQSF